MQEGLTMFLAMVSGILSIGIVQQLCYFILASAAFGLFMSLVRFRQ